MFLDFFHLCSILRFFLDFYTFFLEKKFLWKNENKERK